MFFIFALITYTLFGVAIAIIIFTQPLWLHLLAEAGFFTLFYARYIEPNVLRYKKIAFKIPGLKKPHTIVFISDTQLRKGKDVKWMHKLFAKILAAKPEVVLIGGDLIANQGKGTHEAEFVGTFADLTKVVRTYAVLGNHEYGSSYILRRDAIEQRYPNNSDAVVAKLKEAGVTLLRNEATTLQLGDDSILLYGTDDEWAGKASWTPLSRTERAHPLIALIHNPDTILSYPEDIKKPDLVLAGHTHGGQIRLPFIGPIHNMNLKLGRSFDRGMKNYNDIPLFISHGLGESDAVLRFGVIPEVVVITLTP